jgi:hypothetical protein
MTNLNNSEKKPFKCFNTALYSLLGGAFISYAIIKQSWICDFCSGTYNPIGYVIFIVNKSKIFVSAVTAVVIHHNPNSGTQYGEWVGAIFSSSLIVWFGIMVWRILKHRIINRKWYGTQNEKNGEEGVTH